MHYVIKDLTPAAPTPENAPAQRVTNYFVGSPLSTKSGPDRGHVEQLLQYLVSLGAEKEEGADAA